MDQRIRVEGLKELSRTLRKLSDSKEFGKELRGANLKSAQVVASRAQSRAPVRSGRLRGSIRALAQQRGAQVKGGSKRVPYFGFIDFGGTIRFRTSSRRITRPYIKGGRILYPALAEKRQEVNNIFNEEVKKVMRKAGLQL